MDADFSDEEEQLVRSLLSDLVAPEKRNYLFQIRLTATERQRLEQQAADAGYESLSSYVRVALGLSD